MLQLQPRVAERPLSHLQALELVSHSQSMLVACLQQPRSHRLADLGCGGPQGQQVQAGGRHQLCVWGAGHPRSDTNSCAAQRIG